MLTQMLTINPLGLSQVMSRLESYHLSILPHSVLSKCHQRNGLPVSTDFLRSMLFHRIIELEGANRPSSPTPTLHTTLHATLEAFKGQVDSQVCLKVDSCIECRVGLKGPSTSTIL